jgi:peptide/nickel transport system substrate-binding protein
VFSNGKPVVASDFTYTVERAIKIPWGGSGEFITPVIVGATAYATGKAKTISGITTNDATGKIVIHLTAPYGPFDNVLAFPALGIIPSGFPMKVEPTSPPPGVGPYEVTNIVANQSFDVVQNPSLGEDGDPRHPRRPRDVDVKIDSNVTANALSVLNNTADIFDWADTIPGSLLPQIKSQAADRFRLVEPRRLDVLHLPELPGEAVQQPARPRGGRHRAEPGRDVPLGSGTLVPACFFLPPDVPGHPTAPARTAPRARATWPRPRRSSSSRAMEGSR